MPNLFFTSDEHHGHLNVIKFCNRPFDSLEHMTEELIRRHNERVTKADLVYHLGDMFWRTFGIDNALSVMSRLNGQHFYIRGNHEELFEKNPILSDAFIWIRDRAKVHPPQLGKHPGILLDHFAGRVWDGSHKGRWQLFGHSHGELSKSSQQPFGATEDSDRYLSFDVGVDCWDYYPVSLEEVRATMEEKIEWLRVT